MDAKLSFCNSQLLGHHRNFAHFTHTSLTAKQPAQTEMAVTRRQFTTPLVEQAVPANATDEYRRYATELQALLKALAAHEAMAENLDQSATEPAKYKNKVYFMWDFIGRTLATLFSFDPANPGGRQPSGWEDVKGRAMYASVLIADTSGKLDAMCEDSRGLNPSFGPDVATAAAAIGRSS